MGSTVASYAFGLKNWFNPANITFLTTRNNPAFTKVKKSKGGGDFVNSPVAIGNPQGGSAVFANSQAIAANATGGNLKGLKWLSSFGDYFWDLQIGDKVIALSQDNPMAFMKNQVVEIEGAFKQFGARFEHLFFATAGRTLTTSGFTISTGVCTLVDPEDATNIEYGMWLQASAANGDSASDTLLGSGSIGYVIAVNKGLGTFTVASSGPGGVAATPASWTGTMFAFNYGDFGGSGAVRVFLGLGAWIPPADPSATTFENVDRTLDVTALSGVRVPAATIAGLGTEDRITTLLAAMTGRMSSEPPTDFVIHTKKWQDLATALQNRGYRPLDMKIGGFNYKGIEVAGPAGNVTIWASRCCPPNACFALNFDYIEMFSPYGDQGFPQRMTRDGLEWVRMSASNDLEVRLLCYPAMVVRGPGFLGRVPV